MNFGIITREACINLPPPPDVRCQDQAFALANPNICSAQPRLVIKPGIGLICLYGSIQLRAFLADSSGETDVTGQTLFSSNNTSVVVVGAISGSANATGVTGGTANITASYLAYTATAELTVLPSADCCTEQSVALIVMVDTSKSMSQAFSGGYTTKLVYAKAAATRIIGEINSGKDTVGLMQFNDNSSDVLSAPISSKSTVQGLVAGIAQTQQSTSFFDALTLAISTLDATAADRKVIILISDGQDQTTSYLTNNPIAVADSFKAQGGTIMCLGVRAAGSGFSLLSLLSTGGFFVNAYNATAAVSLDYISGMKGYVCAGNCTPAGDVFTPTPHLNFDDLIHWDVITGTINLVGPGLFDVLPGNGLYLAMDALQCEISSKDTFSFVAGKTYRLRMNLAGNQKVPDAGAGFSIGVGSNVFTVALSDYTQDFTNSSFNFTPAADFTSKIDIVAYTSSASIAWGPLLDAVSLVNVTDLITMFEDSFDNENSIYIPPACGLGTTYTQIADTSRLIVAGAQLSDANGTYTLGGDPAYPTQYNLIGTSYYIRFVAGASQWYLEGREHGVEVAYTSVHLIGLWSVAIADAPAPTVSYVMVNGYASGYGYCDVVGCLDTPPPAQLPDPSALPDVEKGFIPPTVYNSTKTACVSCPAGSVNVSPDNLVPVMTSNTTPSGIAAASSIQAVAVDAWKAFNRVTSGTDFTWQSSNTDPLPQWISYTFPAAKLVKHYAITTYNYSPKDFTFEGSNDGVTWTVLDTQTGVAWFSLERKVFSVAGNVPYTIFRVNVSAIDFGDRVTLAEIELFGDSSSEVCITQSATSTVSQADADSQAMALATAAAQSQLHCVTQYASTETFTASCPAFSFGPPVSKTANATSLISQADADAQALAEAQTLAEDALDCSQSNNTQTITIPASGSGSPYPSIKHVSGVAGHITKATVSLKKLTHTFPDDLLIALRSPNGTMVFLMGNCGGNNPISAVDLTFDDVGAALPDTTAIASGTYHPTRYTPVTNLPSPAPSPASGYNTSLASVIGEDPNGSWSLLVFDDSGVNSGQMLLGWELTITAS